MMKSFSHDRRSGVCGPILHASTVALTPARALTSHLRRRYRERYCRRYRCAALLCAFDFCLVVIAVVLVGLNIWFAVLRPTFPQRYAFSFFAPSLRTAAPVTLVATIQEQGGKLHDRVRLKWDLPDGAEVLFADPSFTQGYEVSLGAIAPQETRYARVSVRLMSSAKKVRIGFRLQDEEGVLTGSETRDVIGSGLRSTIVSPTMFAAGVVPNALLRVENLTALDVPDAGRFVQDIRFGKIKIGALRAFESKVIPTPMLSPHYVSVPFVLPRLSLAPWKPGDPVRMKSFSAHPFQMMVVHHGLSDAEDDGRIVDVGAGEQNITLPIVAVPSKIERWFAIPFVEREGVRVALGFEEGDVTTPFDVSVRVRFDTDEGDQIGVGPMPPRVGEATRMWVTWSLSSTNADLSRVQFRALLPMGVRWTGKSALPNGGYLDQIEQTTLWTLPSWSADDGGATASFEIELRPTQRMRGLNARLLGETVATGVEGRSGLLLRDVFPEMLSETKVR